MPSTLRDSLLNTIPCAIIAIDSSGKVLDLNKAARDLLLPSTVKPIGKSIMTLFPEWRNLLNGLIEGPRRGVEYDVRLPAGEAGHLSMNPIPNFGWSLTIHKVASGDSTEGDQAQMLGEITHDLKEPLTAILSFADLVTASGELNDKQTKFLERIRGAATRMSDQVYQLLDVVWIESGTGLTLAPTNLLNMVKLMLDITETRASAKHIRLALDAPPEIPLVNADLKRLERAMANLVSNAVKYSGENTTVTIQIRADTKELALA